MEFRRPLSDARGLFASKQLGIEFLRAAVTRLLLSLNRLGLQRGRWLLGSSLPLSNMAVGWGCAQLWRQPLALLRVGEDHFVLFYLCAYGNPYRGAKRILKYASTWSRLEEQAERVLGSGLCQLFLLASFERHKTQGAESMNCYTLAFLPIFGKIFFFPF